MVGMRADISGSTRHGSLVGDGDTDGDDDWTAAGDV